MPTTTPKPVREPRRRAGLPGARRRAFTLVEVLIATTLGGIVLAAVLSSFLFLGRVGYSVQNYADMERQARNAMETFALDVRMAYDARWTVVNNRPVAVTVEVEQGGSRVRYTYAYNAAAGTFTRQRTGPSTGPAVVLISGIRNNPNIDFFTAYKIDTEKINFATTTPNAASNMTKQIQISLEAQRMRSTLATATNKVVSARFVLRNKRVTT